VCASHRCFWARILTEIARICAQKREHSGVTNAGAAILAAGSAIIGPCSPSTRTSHSYRTILDPEGKATVADVALIGNELGSASGCVVVVVGDADPQRRCFRRLDG
jgi:hypothetical protein